MALHTATGIGDLAATLAAATEDGAEVLLNFATATFTTNYTWAAPANAVIRGLGSTSILGGNDLTVITDNVANDQPLISITTNASGTFRAYGISITSGSGAGKDHGMIAFSGSCHSFRVDHCHINASSHGATSDIGMFFTGDLWGVRDHNKFDMSTGNTSEAWNVHHDSYGGGTFGHGSWAAATNFGGNDALYSEDNEINNGTFATDVTVGGRAVDRFNILYNVKMQTHPTGGSPQAHRGGRKYEIYCNQLSGVPTCADGGPYNDCVGFAFFLSSGCALIWKNTYPHVSGQTWSAFSSIVSLHATRRTNNPYEQTVTPNGWGYCGTTQSGTGSNWDGNTSGTTGYPGIDQPGRGIGDLLTGDFPNVVNTALGNAIAWPRQALEPVREWLDVFDEVPNNGHVIFNNGDSDTLVEARDFYKGTGSTSVTGGNGHGVLASRPGSAAEGEAYWATDQGDWNDGSNALYTGQGILYVWTSGAWVQYYEPYPYPHPLVSGIVAVPTTMKLLPLLF